ncbi:sigma factor [Arthrobacter sp. E3]|uniref:sigma factor n=1 Tax=Arthrobacter sp. E3 TaxID=517402 RepID=UPI001A93E1BE|nr:sigma factor [Arthrobacter sp. E3]
MGIKSNESQPEFRNTSIDVSLERPPASGIPIDQLMNAVESVRPFVRSRLLRIGHVDDVDDVMQDVRVAAWEGLVKQRYHQLPGITFGAWVQGIAVHLCADHIRRTLARPWMSLNADPEVSPLAPVDFAATESGERVAEHEWAVEVLTTVREHVTAETWELAVECLTAPRERHAGHESGWEKRKGWQAVTTLRHTAVTVRAAMDVEPATLCDAATVIATAVCCLPTVLLQVVAERLVLTGVRGADRAAKVAELSAETGLRANYLEGRISYARKLYTAALDVLERTVAKQPTSGTANSNTLASVGLQLMS